MHASLMSLRRTLRSFCNVMLWLAITPSIVLAQVPVQPKIGTSTTSVNFGSIAVTASPATHTLTVANVTTSFGQTLAIANVSITGPQATEFTFAMSALPLLLSAQDHELITLSFDPIARGPRRAMLTIATNDPVTPMLDIPLFGLGTAPCGVFTPTANGGGTITLGSVALLTGIGPSGASCLWSPEAGLTDPVSCSTFAAPTETTEYQLTVTNFDGCSEVASTTLTVMDADSFVGPPGPAGAQGPPGPQGPKGDKGDPGIGVATGAYVFLDIGSAAPEGFAFMGTSTFSLNVPGLKRQQNLTLNVYRKN